jgi:hypothetical protein
MPQVMTLTVGASTGSQIRTETLAGREYTVVPVIAVVEGVLQGANSSVPEFAAAKEFGKYPDSWNGRPVVLRHPQVQGIFVSAAHPQVYEAYSMGFMFNTVLDGKKLKTEAWLDNARIAELGGEYQETLDRILADEVLDVSVGCFLDTRAKTGTYNGKDYQAAWENVVPDHLAILPDEKGACSVADGCGTNRVASMATFAAGHNEVRIVGPAPCCDSCAHGGECMPQAPTAAQAAPPTEPGQAPAGDPPQEGEQPTPAEPGHGEPAPTPPIPLAAQDGAEPSPEELAAMAERADGRLDILQSLAVSALGNTVELTDGMRLVREALPDHLGVERWAVDVMAMTTDVVVFYSWGEPTLRGFNQIRYTVSDNGTVSFTGDPEPVNLMTKIMPRQTGVAANSGSQSEEVGAMPEAAGQGGNPAPEATTTGTEGAAPAAPTQPVVNAAPASVEDYLAGAPAEIRGVLQAALQAEQNRKTHLIGVIKANSRNKFSDDVLATFSVDQLEGLAVLAAPADAPLQPDYSGRGFHAPVDLSVQSAQPAPVSTFMDVDQNYLLPAAGNA